MNKYGLIGMKKPRSAHSSGLFFIKCGQNSLHFAAIQVSGI